MVSINKNYIWFFCAVIYAGVLASLPVDAFQDRNSYLTYAASSAEIITRYDGFAVLTNEPLWLLLNILLGSVLSSESVVRALVFSGALLVAYYVFREGANNRIFFLVLLLLLCVPQVVKNHIVHLRQGFAIGIFLFGLMHRGGLRWFLFALTPFFHASFFFVLFIYGITQLAGCRMAGRQLSGALSSALLSCVFLFVMFSLSSGLDLTGARQADEYAAAATEGSGIGFLMWSFFLLGFFCQAGQWVRRNLFSIGIVVFYLCAYFLSPFSARIFESALLVVLFAVLKMEGWSSVAFGGVFFLFALSQWLMMWMSGVYLF